MATRKLSQLVEDFDFYPRCSVDSATITALVDALDAGATLPPIIIEKRTNRIVDGIHRVRAYRRKYGPDHEIEVIEKTFADDEALLLACAAANTAHGRNLAPYDQAHVIVRADELGITSVRVAMSLSITVEKLDSLRDRKTAKVMSGTRSVPIKNTISHKRGQRLTKKQCDANTRLGGMRQMYYVNQILILLDADLFDTENEALMVKLQELGERIDAVLGARTE